MGSRYWSLGSPHAGTEENNQATGGMKWGDPRTQGSPASLQGYSGPSSVHQPISREPAAGLIRGDPRAQGAQGYGGPSLLHQPISREPAAGLIRGDPRTQGAPITQDNYLPEHAEDSKELKRGRHNSRFLLRDFIVLFTVLSFALRSSST
nr:uncharacterized protein LOC4345351 isoform X1 [Oryza sativa Japonica Group]